MRHFRGTYSLKATCPRRSQFAFPTPTPLEGGHSRVVVPPDEALMLFDASDPRRQVGVNR